MKIHRALLVSILCIAAVLGLARQYGLNRHLKVRVHPLLDRLDEIRFSANPQKWQDTSYAPYLKVYEQNGELVYTYKDKDYKLRPILEQKHTAYLIAIIKESERVNYLLNEIVSKNHLDDQILVSSKYRNVILNIREVKPRWLTAITPNELFLSIILNKFYLASLAPFKSSILVIDNDVIAQEWLAESPWQEFVRRNYRIIAPQEFQLALPISRTTIH